LADPIDEELDAEIARLARPRARRRHRLAAAVVALAAVLGVSALAWIARPAWQARPEPRAADHAAMAPGGPSEPLAPRDGSPSAPRARLDADPTPGPPAVADDEPRAGDTARDAPGGGAGRARPEPPSRRAEVPRRDPTPAPPELPPRAAGRTPGVTLRESPHADGESPLAMPEIERAGAAATAAATDASRGRALRVQARVGGLALSVAIEPVAGRAVAYTVRITDAAGRPVTDADVAVLRAGASGTESLALDTAREPGVYRGALSLSPEPPHDVRLRVARPGRTLELPLADPAR
jgi:hypothetical protein